MKTLHHGIWLLSTGRNGVSKPDFDESNWPDSRVLTVEYSDAMAEYKPEREDCLPARVPHWHGCPAMWVEQTLRGTGGRIQLSLHFLANPRGKSMKSNINDRLQLFLLLLYCPFLVAGCGANQACILSYNNPGYSFTGVDISKESIKNNEKLIKKHNLKNLNLICEDFRLIKFDKKFDRNC